MVKGILICISLFFVVYRALVVPIPISANIYYCFWLFIALGVVVAGRGICFSKQMIFFLLICFLSVITNDINPLFQSEYRLISFCFVIAAVGPLNNSQVSIYYRFNLFKYLTLLIVISVCVSFILWFTRIPLLFHSNGLYKGIFNHSMMLSPFASVSAIICFQYCLSSLKTNKKLIWFLLFIVSIFTCMLGASRTALAGLLVGLLVFLFFYYRKRIKKLIKMTFISFLLICVSYPIWYPYTENIRMKQEASSEVGGLLTSREVLWEDRYNEFLDKPLLGSGFASMDLNLVKADKFDIETGSIEPGSSWLFLLSSIGILGFVAFVLLAIGPILKEVKRKNEESSTWLSLLSILSCFFVHMTAEGYILSSGSLLFCYVWICVSLIQPKAVAILDLHSKSLLTSY